ncbi:DNA polymerase IV [Agrococcus sediminis]|uniref:DNA polymerase IV n=1 Tax=Agrococcus TaxID=46352 RepID=UPI000FE2A57D|nr:DNA polymerase IV [Agrococcus sp. SCSIO52902]RWR24336.1 DNA polymerase IV [Agrococcus lahaulensis]UOW00429.1 DNA polymerase IV [Agrococcus sp. SCSIO52902]
MSKQDGSNRLVSGPEVDDTTATILHVDLDAFFASASLLARPDLVGLPVVIGHDSSRSVVTAATYEARRYGVHSAMPMARARQLCPRAIILEPDFRLYQRLSSQVMGILDDVSPEVERLGIDEAFVGIAGLRRLSGGANRIGAALRERVRAETGLVASVGAAGTKHIAKLASSRAKPDGLLVVPDDAVLGFLHPQPVSALWGVGPKQQERLARYGLHTVGDVAATPLERLMAWFGEATGRHLHDLAWARDPREVRERPHEKTFGHNHTFSHDVTAQAELQGEILRLATGVGRRLRDAGVQARTVTLTVRFHDFRTITRSRTLPEPTDVTRVLVETAWSLLDALGGLPPVRLLGVRASSVQDAADHGLLWDDTATWGSAERAMDAVHDRFGAAAVAPASMLRRERKRDDTGPSGGD